MNTTKMKALILFGGASSRRISPEAYARRFDKSLPTQRERSLQKVRCPRCPKSVNRQHLTLHMHEAHGTPMLQLPSDNFPINRHTYYVDFPLQGLPIPCPVLNCPATPTTRNSMRRHFCMRHDPDIIIILQEGELPQCPYCNLFTWSIGPKHFATATCRTQAACVRERERVRLQVAQAKSIVFYVNGVAIDTVTEFKYLGHILSADDRDDATVSYNIKRASDAWFGMYRILSRDGANPKTMARFYLAVVQAKLLYGSETWVLSERLLQRLERFHARCARWIAHRHIRRLPDGTWECPNTADVLECCGLSPIATYIAKRKTTLLHNYAQPSSSIYQRCITSTPVGSGAHRQMWWT